MTSQMQHSSTGNLTKSQRAKLARQTINQTIPALLRAHPRAAKGVAAAQLLTTLPASTVTSPTTTFLPTVRVVDADTLAAAAELRSGGNKDRVAVLSMASALRPGGGVLTGATSQEESLCMRTTLYVSLREEWYRLPEEGLIYTPDALVFRTPKMESLKKDECWYVDVISCAAPRCPELSDDERSYAAPRDQDGMRARMVQVLRCARAKGVKRIVLGALGCGAYGNPPEEVARLWHAVLKGGARTRPEEWGLEEVVFAIKVMDKQSTRNLEVFQGTFSTYERQSCRAGSGIEQRQVATSRP